MIRPDGHYVLFAFTGFKAGRPSIVWKVFEVDDLDESKCICQICHTKLSRGPAGNPNGFCTTTMLQHVKTAHQQHYVQLDRLKHGNRFKVRSDLRHYSQKSDYHLTHVDLL